MENIHSFRWTHSSVLNQFILHRTICSSVRNAHACWRQLVLDLEDQIGCTVWGNVYERVVDAMVLPAN